MLKNRNNESEKNFTGSSQFVFIKKVHVTCTWKKNHVSASRLKKTLTLLLDGYVDIII